jgi:hypothetical protein
MQDGMVASTLATDNSTFCSIEIPKVINRTEHVYSSTSPDDDSTEDRNAQISPTERANPLPPQRAMQDFWRTSLQA